MKAVTIYIFLCFYLLLAACDKNNTPALPHGYYTMEIENYAWGYTHTGWMFDKEGKAKAFDLPSDWQRPDSLGFISEEDLQKNLSFCTTNKASVTKKTLNKFNALIPDAAAGIISTPRSTGNDMGQQSWYCYLYDADRKMYKRVLLASKGDFTYGNESEAAKEILDWMDDIQ